MQTIAKFKDTVLFFSVKPSHILWTTSFYSVLAVSLLGHIVIVFRNLSYKDQIAKLQEMFVKNACIDHEILKAERKWLIVFWIAAIPLFWSGFLIFFIGFAMLLEEEFGISLQSQVPLIFLATWVLHQLYSPIFCYTQTFFEIACSITAWIETLLLNQDLDDCYHLLQVISVASEAMSLQHFSLVIMSVIILIGVTFSVVSYFIVNANEDLTAQFFAFLTLGIGLVAICTTFFLTSLVSFAQKIVDKVHELGNLLRRLPVNEENVVLDKDIIEWRDFRDIILHDIDCFQGLDGYGYFCINKSLLTSIVANFMTYFIILIDFKIN